MMMMIMAINVPLSASEGKATSVGATKAIGSADCSGQGNANVT